MMTPGPSLYVLNKVTSNCSKIGNNDNALLEHAVYDDSPFETLFNLSEVRQQIMWVRFPLCPILAISYIGAEHDFEIWAFKVFFSLDKKSTP